MLNTNGLLTNLTDTSDPQKDVKINFAYYIDRTVVRGGGGDILRFIQGDTSFDGRSDISVKVHRDANISVISVPVPNLCFKSPFPFKITFFHLLSCLLIRCTQFFLF